MLQPSRQLKKSAIFIALLCSTVLLTTSVQAGFFNGKTRFYTVKTDHFYLHYSAGLGGVAEEMRVVTEKVHARMTERLQYNPKRRTHIVLTDKTETANGVASVLPDNYILLYVAIPTPDSTLDHYRDYYEYLFTHEYTHILHIDQTNRWASPGRVLLGKIIAPNGATPGWMREGMAVYEESLLDGEYGRNNADMTEMYLRTSYYEEKFPRIDQIAGLGTHYPAGIGAYLYGGRFFEWLGENYGEDRMYQYQKEYASSLWLYALNNKARRVYGKSFYKLWREFKTDLKSRYDAEKNSIQAKGLTSLTPIVRNDNSQSGYLPHPNGKGFAWYETGYDESPVIIVNPNDGAKPHRLKRRLFGQMSFSRDGGRYLAFGSLSSVEKKTSLADVYYYDLKNRKMFRAVEANMAGKSMRAMDPDFSPADSGNRWLVMVRNYQNTDQLYVFDLFEKRGYVITDAPAKTQFSNPRYSPDGLKIAVSRKESATGRRDIVVYTSLGRELYKITDDASPDLQPVFSRDGNTVYFSSSRSGVFNIHAYDMRSNTLSRVTNVLSGVFQPMPGVSGDEMFVQAFSTKGNTIQRFDAGQRNPSLWSLKNAVKRKTGGTKQAGGLRAGAVSPHDSTALMTPTVLPSGAFADRYTLLPNTGAEETPDAPSAVENTFRPQLGFYPPEDIAVTLRPHEDGAVPALPSKSANADDAPEPSSTEAQLEDTDSMPVVPISTSPREPQTAPRRKSHRVHTPDLFTRKRKGVENNGAPKSTDPKVYPSKYKDSLSIERHDMPYHYEPAKGSKKYTAFPHLLRPSYIIPNVLAYESAVLASLVIGKFDPLYRHSWSAFIDYRTDAKFTGGGGTYIYSRYDPTFYLGGLRYVVDWGTLTAGGVTTRFFEERWQTYIGASYKYKFHTFNTSYFYEHRSALTQLAGVNLVNMKPYAGLKLQYSAANYKKFPDSVSQEDGYLAKVIFDVTNSALLSDTVNEEYVGIVDARYYFEMPWSDHHVLALRAAAGWQWGDIQQFGTFRMGGPLGEGAGAAKYSPRIFPLRGLAGISYGGDRAFIFSGEYRFPLVSDFNMGIGTWPIFLDKLHMLVFVDGGDIKYRSELPDLFTRLMVAGGVELKGDFMLGYGLPITGRLGYGLILTNRDRLGNLVDSITNASLKYGSVYIQVGTSF